MCVGGVDLSSAGRINGSESKTMGRIAIDGEVPLAELEGYEPRLRALTGGEGTADSPVRCRLRVLPAENHQISMPIWPPARDHPLCS